MAKYFEPITLFQHKVMTTEHPTKIVPRISVDMGIGTFLSFVLNEAYIFGLRWGPDKAAYVEDKERILSLMRLARELTGDLDKYYSTLDYFRSNPHLEDLVPGLMAGSYNTRSWDFMIKTIESYESITED